MSHRDEIDKLVGYPPSLLLVCLISPIGFRLRVVPDGHLLNDGMELGIGEGEDDLACECRWREEYPAQKYPHRALALVHRTIFFNPVFSTVLSCVRFEAASMAVSILASSTESSEAQRSLVVISDSNAACRWASATSGASNVSFSICVISRTDSNRPS